MGREDAVGQRPRELTPYASPLHLWGAELRWRRSARGLSLAQLGRVLHCDPSYLAKIERAQRRPPRDVVAAADRALDAGGALVRLHAMATAGQPPTPSGDRRGRMAAADVANPGADVANPSDPMAQAPALPASWQPDGEIITVPVRTADGRTCHVPLSRRHVLAALGAAAAGGIAAPSWATGADGAAGDLHPAEQFRRLRAVLADADNVFGPARVMAAVGDQIALLQQMRRGMRGADARELVQVLTEYADLAGWLHQDVGESAAAGYWLDWALEWSHLAGDTTATVFVLARKSQLAADRGQPVEAVEVADAALRMAPPGSRMAAIASTYGAHGHALAGEAADCARGYARARDLAAAAGPDEAPWGQFFTTEYLEVQQAHSRMVLGDHHGAAQQYQSAIAALPEGFHRDRGVYLARQALAHAADRDPEQAAAVGLRALGIAGHTRSARALRDLARLHDTLPATTTVAAVREFRAAYADTGLHHA